MLEQRIQQQFFECADLLGQSAGVLGRPVAALAEAVFGCVTGGGKVLVAGSDAGSALARILAANLAGRFERERPPLAALALRDDTLQRLEQQVRALGQPGDLLLLVDAGGAAAPLLDAARSAQAQDMTLAVLAGADTSAWRPLLGEADILVAVPHERPARVAETHLLVLHCLCDAVDLQLMGELEPA
jgi:D-sedoheptulose 7-phosphate isomerase